MLGAVAGVGAGASAVSRSALWSAAHWRRPTTIPTAATAIPAMPATAMPITAMLPPPITGPVITVANGCGTVGRGSRAATDQPIALDGTNTGGALLRAPPLSFCGYCSVDLSHQISAK